MALSAKQTDYSSSSSSSNYSWKYDVFLSFSGKDVRGKFCEDLYEALSRAKIRTFMDDKTGEKGHSIHKEIFQAIEDSRYSIIIFSKKYAFSAYCLDELLKVVKGVDRKKGHEAFPLFFNISSDNVRNQTGVYETAFNDHQNKVQKKRVKKQMKILKWRLALKKAADYIGWTYPNPRNYRSESQLINHIVDTILDKLRRLSPGIGTELVPVKSTYFSEELDYISILWICGMGGMCNAITARVVYARKVYGERRNRLASGVPMQITGAWAIKSEIDWIMEKLKLKKVLVVLDDMHKLTEMVCLAGDHGLFGPGSKIIVLARDDWDKKILNLLSISFDGNKNDRGRNDRQFLDIACFAQDMNDHNVMKIMGPVIGGIKTNMMVITQKAKV